jgi:hypothetical protein
MQTRPQISIDGAVTMHANDCSLVEDCLEDLSRDEAGGERYAKRSCHRTIGSRSTDYDTISRELRSANFGAWICFEDGVNGMTELAQNVRFYA